MALSTNPTDVLNDVEAAAVTTILADTFLGNGTTTLSAAIDADDVTIPLTSKAKFAAAGEILIGTERISYTGTSGNSLTGATRGIRGTTADSHALGATVKNYNVVTVHQKLRDIGVGRAYYDEELPAIAAYAYGAAPDAGDTFGQWDQPINVVIEIVNVGADLDGLVTNVQRTWSEVRRLMRYQLSSASGNLNGIADAVTNEGGGIFIETLAGGIYRVRGESYHTVTLITTE